MRLDPLTAARASARAASSAVTFRSATNDTNGIVPASITSTVFTGDQRDRKARLTAATR